MKKNKKKATPAKEVANKKTFINKTENDIAKGNIIFQQYFSQFLQD